MPSRFQTDLSQQQRVRDLVLGPGLYDRFHVARYVYVEKGRLAEELQQRACDTLVNNDKGELVAIEEKIVRWTGEAYKAVTLEVMSCTVPGREKVGWIHKDHDGAADWLNYAMCQGDGTVKCYLIPFQKLKAAFNGSARQFPETTSTQVNRTRCAVVDLAWIKGEVGYSLRHIHPCPDGVEAVKAYNSTHYRNGRHELR